MEECDYDTLYKNQESAQAASAAVPTGSIYSALTRSSGQNCYETSTDTGPSGTDEVGGTYSMITMNNVGAKSEVRLKKDTAKPDVLAHASLPASTHPMRAIQDKFKRLSNKLRNKKLVIAFMVFVIVVTICFLAVFIELAKSERNVVANIDIDLSPILTHLEQLNRSVDNLFQRIEEQELDAFNRSIFLAALIRNESSLLSETVDATRSELIENLNLTAALVLQQQVSNLSTLQENQNSFCNMSLVNSVETLQRQLLMFHENVTTELKVLQLMPTEPPVNCSQSMGG